MRPRLSSVGAGRPQPRRIFKPVPRPRVSQLLDSAHRYTVTVLVAGAGYGKSVALDHWLGTLPEDVVRYDVLEGTRGVFDFALGFATAIAPKVKLGVKAAANAVNSAEKSTSPDVDLAAWFANALRKFQGTIVLDDFHVAAADDPSVSRLLARLVERTGEHIRWIVASRNTCELPISSWIAYGQSQMAIGERELTFTHEEATGTCVEVDTELTETQINELYAYTGGWPTALTFALLSAQRTLDLDELRATTQELSYQYLAEQVLLGLSPDESDFLLRTCVYERIDLDVLTHAGVIEPRTRLQYLKDQGTFVVRDSEGGIRYHDLFRDFLRNRLGQSDALHNQAWRDAGVTYEALGRYAQALSAYQNAGDFDSISAVLDAQGFALIEHGQRRSVMRALEVIGTQVNLEQYPGLLALRANCEANYGDPKRAEAWYREAIARATNPVKNAELRLQFARELMQENRPEGAALLEPALCEQLPLFVKVAVMGTLATHYWHAHRRQESLSMIAAALIMSAPLAGDEIRAVLLHQSAYLLVLSGEMEAGHERAMQALGIAKELDLHALSAKAQSLLYYINAMADNIAQALWWAKQMQRSSTEAGDMTLMFSALIAAYELEVERGNLENLPALSEQLRNFDADRYSRGRVALLPAFALQAAWQRRFEESHLILKETHTQQPTALRRALRAAEASVYAAAAGKRLQAEVLCRYAQEQFRIKDDLEPYLPKRHAKALVFLGVTELLLGKLSSANKSIGAAEKMSGRLPERSKALVRAARAMFVHLETRSLEDEVETAFGELDAAGYAGVARLFRGLPMPTLERGGTSAVLTRTEIEVLRALERAGESKAAALELGKSPHTIDWHVKSIMKKLGVSTRREAILFARDRGLIG
ncbi:MAG: LuxR C-terminal-related transcriptional regulator [Candidatus Baltobacteraceae bacterium]